MKVTAIIPSRYESSRFPGKPLIDISGLPMIIRVANQVNKVLDKKDIYVATDDTRIYNVVKSYGYNCIMTGNCLTGTDRVVEVSKNINSDIYINIQGDEPLINPNHIEKIINFKKENMGKVCNCMLKIENDIEDINIVKVVTNKNDNLIYASRSIIPYKSKDKFRQLGLYAFSKVELEVYGSVKERSKLEQFEDVEILRFLDLNIPIKMLTLDKYYPSIDTIKDLELVNSLIKGGANDSF